MSFTTRSGGLRQRLLERSASATTHKTTKTKWAPLSVVLRQRGLSWGEPRWASATYPLPSKTTSTTFQGLTGIKSEPSLSVFISGCSQTAGVSWCLYAVQSHSNGAARCRTLSLLQVNAAHAGARVSQNADRAIIESWTPDIILPFAHFKKATRLLSIFRATATMSLLSYQETINIKTFDSVATAKIYPFGGCFLIVHILM